MKSRHANRNGANQLRNTAKAGRRTQSTGGRTVEPLEARTLMSGTLAGGIVYHPVPIVVHPAPIVYHPSPVVPLYTVVNGASGNDVIDIFPGTTPGNVEVTVNGSVKLNENWSSISPLGLVIDGNGGNDVVNVGSGNLNLFAANLTIQDTGGKATINICDKMDNANRTVTQTSKYGEDIITGVAPTTISFVESQTTAVTIKLGNGNDLIHAGAGNQTIIVGNGQDTIYGGSGHDTITTGSGNDLVVTIGDGPAQINGGGGINSYWTDSGSNQKITDSNLGWDKLLGNVHTVSGYQKLVVDYVNGGGTVWQTPALGALTAPLLEPDSTNTVGGLTYAYQNFSSNPLFAPGGPTQNDVQQGGIGDCGFLAGLAGYAKGDSNWIEQSVVPLGDGTYAVRFFKTATDPVYYRIDGSLPVNGGNLVGANLGVDNSIWVALLEKAFTFFRLGQGSYASIQGGGPLPAFISIGSGGSNVWGTNATNVLSNIANALNDYEVVVAATVLTPTASDYVVGSHCYTVESVNYSGGVPVSITLRNPWGYDGPNINNNPSAIGTLSAAQFYRDFFTTDVGGY